MATWAASSLHVVWIFYGQEIQNTFLKRVTNAIQVFFFFLTFEYWAIFGSPKMVVMVMPYICINLCIFKVLPGLSFVTSIGMWLSIPRRQSELLFCAHVTGEKLSQVWLILGNVLAASPGAVMEPESAHSWRLVRHIATQLSIHVVLGAWN